MTVVTFYALLWTGVCVLLPLFLAAAARRRLGAGWPYFAYGALIYALADLLFHSLPPARLVQVMLALASPWRGSHDGQEAAWRAVLAILIAVIGEGSRYLGYLALIRRENRTWEKAVMYGLGCGWLRAMRLAPLTSLGPWLAGLDHASGWTVLRVWGAAWGIPRDVALSVLILQVFRQRRLRWLGLAILAHALYEAASFLLGRSLFGSSWSQRFLLRAALDLSFGAASLWLIAALRERPVGGNQDLPSDHSSVATAPCWSSNPITGSGPLPP